MKREAREYTLELCLPKKYLVFTYILCLFEVSLERLLESVEGFMASRIVSQISESILTKAHVFQSLLKFI